MTQSFLSRFRRNKIRSGPHGLRGSLLTQRMLLPLLFAATAIAQQAQLRIAVTEGADALNNIQLSANKDVVVTIVDANQAPISGATVTFVYPGQGASGTFPNGTRTASITTNMEGKAAASGVRPVGGTGTLQIRVTAVYLGRTATAVISQTNVAALAPAPNSPEQTSTASPDRRQTKKAGISKKAKILIVLAIAGGAAAGAVVATRGGASSNTGTSTITITPGTPTVGGPR